MVFVVMVVSTISIRALFRTMLFVPRGWYAPSWRGRSSRKSIMLFLRLCIAYSTVSLTVCQIWA